MGDYNDGRAFSYQNTGESVMIFDNTLRHVEVIRTDGLVTTLGLTSLNQSLDCVSGMVDPQTINGIKSPVFKVSGVRPGHANQTFWMDTVVDSAAVVDESYETTSNVHQAQTVVAGETFDTKYVTWHMRPTVLKKMKPTTSHHCKKVIRMSNEWANVGDKRKFHESISFMAPLVASVYELPNQYIIKNGSTLIDDNQVVPMGSGTNILQPLTASVEDYKPPVFGNTGSGSGVKDMAIIVQKNTYANIYMTFDDTKITEVQGLPQGMSYNNQYIFGAPATSGVYNVNIKLDNLRTLTMTLQVPEFPRTL